MGLADEVRANCAAIARDARSVRIDLDAAAAVEPAPPPALDPACHFLDGDAEQVAMYMLTLDSINFGSGWFGALRKRTLQGRPLSGYLTVAWALSDQFRAHGPWTAAQLAAMSTTEIADTLRQPPELELVSLYAQALRALGRFLGPRPALQVVAEARGSAQALARSLAEQMPMFNDVGYYKRAQITAHDLSLAGVANFVDVDALTMFADNLVAHVLRWDGVLVYEQSLAEHIDAGRPLPMSQAEREIRACAVHAVELIAQRTGSPARAIDNWLWNRGQQPRYKSRPRHRTKTVFY